MSSNQEPQIVRLPMLDTDYARMMAGEVIPESKQRRLAAEHYDFKKLGKQIARYRLGGLDQQGQDDVLCNIGATAELFSRADLEDMDDRLRHTGEFYLTPGERLQVMNWLQDELGVDLRDGSADG